MGLSEDREARQDVAEVLVRYATGIDRRDWKLFRTCFTDDCDADYGAVGHWHGVDELTDWMEKTHQPFGHTMHRITNQAMTATAGGMAARSYVHVILQLEPNVIHGYGFYDDELVHTDDGWKIATRRFTMVHQRTDPMA